MRYAIVIEKAEGNFSAYVPDLPGCVATGTTVEETEKSIREAIEFHLDACARTIPQYPLRPAVLNMSRLLPNFRWNGRSDGAVAALHAIVARRSPTR